MSGCRRLTDESVARFLALAKRLQVLILAHNPQLTDAALKPMHESPVIYGNKACNGCKRLTRIVVRLPPPCAVTLLVC